MEEAGENQQVQTFVLFRFGKRFCRCSGRDRGGKFGQPSDLRHLLGGLTPVFLSKTFRMPLRLPNGVSALAYPVLGLV
jgi:hypothetical protein